MSKLKITITFDCENTPKNIRLIEGKKNEDGCIDYSSPSIAKSIRDKIFNYSSLRTTMKEAAWKK